MPKIVKTTLTSLLMFILVGCGGGGGGGNAGSDAILKAQDSSGAALTISTVVMPTSQ